MTKTNQINLILESILDSDDLDEIKQLATLGLSLYRTEKFSMPIPDMQTLQDLHDQGYIKFNPQDTK